MFHSRLVSTCPLFPSSAQRSLREFIGAFPLCPVILFYLPVCCDHFSAFVDLVTHLLTALLLKYSHFTCVVMLYAVLVDAVFNAYFSQLHFHSVLCSFMHLLLLYYVSEANIVLRSFLVLHTKNMIMMLHCY